MTDSRMRYLDEVEGEPVNPEVQRLNRVLGYIRIEAEFLQAYEPKNCAHMCAAEHMTGYLGGVYFAAARILGMLNAQVASAQDQQAMRLRLKQVFPGPCDTSELDQIIDAVLGR